jgi:hypothetical protein
MKRIAALFLVVCVIFLSTSCGVVNKYNGLVEAYQNAQKAAANGRVSLALGYNKIQNYMDMYNKYLSTDVEKTKAYRDALNNYGTKLTNQNKEYLDQNGQPLDPSKIDLNQLVASKATPADMAINITSYANQFSEAPLQGVDEKSLENTQRYVSEAYNEIYANIQDWNTAVNAYNSERNKATGDIIGRAAEALRVKELPEELPYFSMPVSNSLPQVK